MCSHCYSKRRVQEKIFSCTLHKLFGTDRRRVIPKKPSVTGTIGQFVFRTPNCFFVVSRFSKTDGSRSHYNPVLAPLLIGWRKSAVRKRRHQRQRVCKERTEPGGTIIHRLGSRAEPKRSNPRSKSTACCHLGSGKQEENR